MRSLILLFLVAALLVFLPFRADQEFLRSGNRKNAPAGEITNKTTIVQKGHLPATAASSGASGQQCFGIQFATYARQNSGHLNVAWSQVNQNDHWTVDTAKLKDNQFEYFCPRRGIRFDSDFQIEITGIDGRAGHSPTSWLTEDTILGTIEINGKPQHRSLSLSFANRLKLMPGNILRVDHGMFALGWFLSVIIGFVALSVTKRPQATKLV